MNGIQSIRDIARPIYNVRGWMKFAGALSVVQGVILVFTLWGIAVCWIPIWMGVALFSASERVKSAYETENEEELKTSLEKIGKYFKIFGVFILTMLVVIVLGVIAAIFIPTLIPSRMPI